MIKITISGILGKMGKSLYFLIKNSSQFQLVGGLSHSNIGKNIRNIFNVNNEELVISDDFNKMIEKSDVVIDFSTPSSLDNLLKFSIKHKKPLVIGTTGYSLNDFTKIEKASKKIPILYSSNFSTGMAILKFLVKEAAKKFKERVDIDILEIHHNQKKDAPSGSAKTLQGEINNIISKDINMHSIRSKNIIGEHFVSFTDDFERIKLSHEAFSRDVFSKGALMASEFILNKPIGLYCMEDLL